MLNILNATIITPTLYYIISGVLALLVMYGIYLMSKVEKAKLGNQISAVAVFLGVIVTLIKYDIFSVWVLYIGILIGAAIGVILTVKIKMIAMPQLIALLNGLGGLASLLVGMFAYLGVGVENVNSFSNSSALLAIIIGGITFTGSLIAAGKLARLINQKPVKFKFQQQTLILLLVLMLAILVYAVTKSFVLSIYLLVILSFVFGVIFTIQIGGADMPIAISLLNSLSGVAGAISGLAIGDALLVAIGGIVGASGLLLTQIMCRAMNRHLFEILLGKTTTKEVKKQVVEEIEEVEEIEDEPKIAYKEIIKTAKKVIIIPGYGMAVAQAQHILRQIGDQLKGQGKDVKYAIHPVAGRMPGHMNVLLAEANVDYDELYEMDDVNDEFKNTDLVVVVGANDVLNPAAREAEGTPIYGMPILNADQAKNIFIFNYDLNPGYSGVNNPLYKKKKGVYLFLGNALDTLKEFQKEL